MLNNPQWDDQTKVEDIFALSSLIEWLEKKPSDERYQYHNTYTCMICQYLNAKGLTEVIVTTHTIFHNGGPYTFLPVHWDYISSGSCNEYISLEDIDKWTFGQALKRARQFV